MSASRLASAPQRAPEQLSASTLQLQCGPVGARWCVCVCRCIFYAPPVPGPGRCDRCAVLLASCARVRVLSATLCLFLYLCPLLTALQAPSGLCYVWPTEGAGLSARPEAQGGCSQAPGSGLRLRLLRVPLSRAQGERGRAHTHDTRHGTVPPPQSPQSTEYRYRVSTVHCPHIVILRFFCRYH